MSESGDEPGETAPAERGTSGTSATDGLPTYVKVLLGLVVLVIVFIVVLDLLVVAGGF